MAWLLLSINVDKGIFKKKGEIAQPLEEWSSNIKQRDRSMVLPYDINWETKESFYDTFVWYPLENHKCQPCLQIFFGVFEPHFHVILKWLLSYLRESGLLRHSFDEFGRVQKLACLDRRGRAGFHSLKQVDSVTFSNISPNCFFKALRVLSLLPAY